MPMTFEAPLEPSSSLAERLAGLTSVTACYQCKKCSAGCPLTFAMDFYPDQVIRLARVPEGSGAPAIGLRICPCRLVQPHDRLVQRSKQLLKLIESLPVLRALWHLAP